MNQQIFKEIQALKRKLLPYGRVILFGSQARGDARPDSDWDLLVLLDKKGKITSEEDTRYGYPFAELGFNHKVCICALIYSIEEWEKRKISPFYKNVTNEGIEIV
jgi:predicted nucleotidyltransferase